MMNKDDDSSDDNVAEVGEVTADELRQLMTLRGEECRQAIRQQYSSIEGLCQRLHTDPDLG